MKIVFIAGPYRGKDLRDVYSHVSAAEKVQMEFAKRKIPFFSPISHTAFLDHFLREDDPGYPFWIGLTLEMLGRCDAIYTMQGWENSEGARAELVRALELGLPWFDNDIEAVERWYANAR